MLGIISAGVAIAACLLATTMLWGENPSTGRLAVSTLLGVVGATLSWMIIGNVLGIPDDGSTLTTLLAMEMIVLSVVLVLKGRQRGTMGTVRK